MATRRQAPLWGPLLEHDRQQVDNLLRHMRLIPFYRAVASGQNKIRTERRNRLKNNQLRSCYAVFRPVDAVGDAHTHPVPQFLP